MSPDQITLELPQEEELERTATPSSSSSAREYRCGACGRRLKPDRWIYSRHTSSRYCWPGESKGGK